VRVVAADLAAVTHLAIVCAREHTHTYTHAAGRTTPKALTSPENMHTSVSEAMIYNLKKKKKKKKKKKSETNGQAGSATDGGSDDTKGKLTSDAREIASVM
jgi:hypothetical protein